MLELLAAGAVSVLIGVVVARWWVVPVPLAAVGLWVAGAALFVGEDREGTDVWVVALFFGGFFAAASAVGLSVGVLCGKWLRRRRRSRRCTPLPQ